VVSYDGGWNVRDEDPPVALSSGRQAWRSEDVHPVLRRDGDEPLHVRRTVERRRHNTFGGWLTDLSDEPLEQKWLEANKGFTSIGRLRDERMRHPLRTEGKRTGRQGQPSIANIEGELTIEDVEPLIFIGMDVPGRAEARRNNYLDQAVLPGSVVSTDLDRSSMPRTQKASPSSAPSLYPSVARCGETSDMQHTSLCRTGLLSPAVLHNVGEYEA
jgi:hypothetical protein